MKVICSDFSTRHNNNPGTREALLAYLIGLERLGHEAYLIEEVDSARCYDADCKPVAFEEWEGWRLFEWWTKAFGVWPRCSLIYNRGEATHGMPFPEVVRLAKECDLLLMLGGLLQTREVVDNVRCRAYFDGNPGKTQVYQAEYGIDQGFADYHYFFTVGLNIGTPRCDLPTCGLTWHGVLPLVVLSMWPPSIDERCERFTTLSSFAGRHTFYWKGQYSGEKSDNWLRFAELPRRTRQPLEIALDIDPAYEADRKLLQENGWLLTDPKCLSTFDDLRRYYARSRGEFSVAHNRYVAFNTGWFSERSARYLALGKPVLVQSTGTEDHLPTGKGLLTFTTLEEALAGLEAINRDYLAHCRAARAIAEEYFNSDKVLRKMLQIMGLSK
jgi:hypothetical protein